uniref:Uncharacterized protein n=1 Tax=Steinernema glaseri TaxID=37863 RepID=A0A1I7XZ88_9BILA
MWEKCPPRTKQIDPKAKKKIETARWLRAKMYLLVAHLFFFLLVVSIGESDLLLDRLLLRL